MVIQKRFGLSLLVLSCLGLSACDFNDNDGAPAPAPTVESYR